MAKKQSHRYKIVMLVFTVAVAGIAVLGFMDMRPPSGEASVALATDILR
jgi:hypothetical protein